MTTHFHNFTPADAVQYDGEHGDEALFDVVRSEIRWGGQEGWPIRKGQWLVRQGSRVWVQDEEPARVVKWEFRVVGSRSGGKWLEHSLEGALLTQRMYGGLIERRPVLSNGWTGPWLPVDGGAE